MGAIDGGTRAPEAPWIDARGPIGEPAGTEWGRAVSILSTPPGIDHSAPPTTTAPVEPSSGGTAPGASGGRIGTSTGSVAYLPQTKTLRGLGREEVGRAVVTALADLPPGGLRTVSIEALSAGAGPESEAVAGALAARTTAPGLRVEAWMSGFSPLPSSPLYAVAEKAGAILCPKADGSGRVVIDLTNPAVLAYVKRTAASLGGADAISADDHFSVPPEARAAFLARHPMPAGFAGGEDAWVQGLIGKALTEVAGAARSTGKPFTLSIGGTIGYFKKQFAVDAVALARSGAIDGLELQLYRDTEAKFAKELEVTKRAVAENLDAFRNLPGGLRIAVAAPSGDPTASAALLRAQERQVAELDRWLKAQGVSGGATIVFWDAAHYPR